MNFHGVKIAIIVNNKLLVFLRDNKPSLFNANMWDLPGGGRENEESPLDCIVREVYEEFELELTRNDITWQKAFPAQKDPNQIAYFMVAEIESTRTQDLKLHEGQKWTFMTIEEFLGRDDVIPALKERFQAFLDQK